MCRIFVDLPDAGNRTKILKIILSKENLEHGFRYEELADATEGYSGSDLKVWYPDCVQTHVYNNAFAYRSPLCRTCALLLRISQFKNFWKQKRR